MTVGSTSPRIDVRSTKLLIGGEWVEAASGEVIPTFNPSTGELLAEIARGDRIDIDRAVAAARQAFEGPWRSFKPRDRQRVLLRFAELVERHYEEIYTLDTLEMGRPIAGLEPSRENWVGRLHYYAGMATGLTGDTIENSLPGSIMTYTLKEPVGVVGAIIPWNGPHGMSIWKIGPTLATGCTLVLKPAEEGSLSPLRLAELALEAGVPPGVINVVTGTGESAGAALAEHRDVDKLNFTGSHVTGQAIVRASAGNLKRLSLELGGKSPDIVFADADLDKAAPAAALGVFANAGQVCYAGSRLFVEAPVYDTFLERVVDVADGLRIGDGLDPETQIGPLVSQRQVDRVLGYVELAAEEGAQRVTGGSRVSEPGLKDGFFIRPTVLESVDNSMRIAQEEVFGPVVSVLRFTDIRDVVRLANTTQFGLAGGVWTRDAAKAHRVARELRAGTVWVNCFGLLDAAVPFGGYKMSGYGREGGAEQIADYVNVKSVFVDLGPEEVDEP
jgi:aldehyde dehydrogenase (NAD+)